jgi:hypothetical protein
MRHGSTTPALRAPGLVDMNRRRLSQSPSAKIYKLRNKNPQHLLSIIFKSQKPSSLQDFTPCSANRPLFPYISNH